MRLLLSILLFFFAPFGVVAQTISLISPIVNATCNNTIDVPVKIKGFQQLLSLQGSIGWDASKMRFQGITSYGPTSLNLGAGNFGTNATANGYVTFSWNDADMSGETLSDSTSIFTLRFTVIATSNTSCSIQFLNNPTLLEAINTNLASLSFLIVNGNINISCSAQTNLGLILPMISANCNTIIDIPIKVKAFQGINSLQGLVSWDPSKLQYQSISSYGPTSLAITSSNFSITNVSNGKIKFVWNDVDQSGETLTDSTILFTLRLFVLNSGMNNTSSSLNFDTSPTSWSASSNASTSIPIFLSNGQVNINCSLSSNFQFILPQLTGICNNIIDVPVKVKNFRSILSMQGSIGWDTSKLQFQAVTSYGPASLSIGAGNFGMQSVSSGKLTYSWNDNDLSGETLSDSEIIFTIRYTVISTSNESTILSFLNNPTPVEVVDAGYNSLSTQLLNGSVSVSCVQTSPISLILPNVTPNCSAVIDIPIKVKDFINILAFQGSINWNSSVLQYQSISNFGPSLLSLSISNFGINNVSNGKLSFSWNDFDLTGESLSDSTTLFFIRFLVIGSNNNNAALQFSNNPTPIEVIKTGLSTLQTNLFNGSVIVSCNAVSNFQFIAPSTNVSCSSTVDIPIKVKNFQNILSYQGSLNWDSSLLRFQSIVSYGPVQLGLSAANFGNNHSQNGVLSFSWSDGDLSGENLPDSTVLFILRFSTLGTNGESSSINFGNTPTPIELVNTLLNAVQYNLVNGNCYFNCSGVTYTFIGNGNWDISSNWLNNTIPPAILPSGDHIIIDPIITGECFLNVQQTINQGASITVMNSKKFRIPGVLQIQ